ncbi:MAG: hypothetical protein GY876_07700 [Planctomycetes bacterium]|nr:hypothetical protein [Planctomycetota bacterium]
MRAAEMLELVHAWTSEAVSGKPGFTTLFKSPKLGKEATAVLEARSGLTMHPPAETPPLLAHRILKIDGTWRSALSHIAMNDGATKARPNRTAHHLLLTKEEHPANYGPAALLRSGWFLSRWNDGVRPNVPPLPEAQPLRPHAAIDEAWAAALATMVLRGIGFIIRLPEGSDPYEMLSQIEDALPPERRWELTFLIGGTLHIDGVLVRVLAHNAAAPPDAEIIDLASSPPREDLNRGDDPLAHDAATTPASLYIEPSTTSRNIVAPIVVAILAGLLALLIWHGMTT